MQQLIQQVLHAASYDEGLKRGRALIARLKGRYPSAMACLEEDLEACLARAAWAAFHDGIRHSAVFSAVAAGSTRKRLMQHKRKTPILLGRQDRLCPAANRAMLAFYAWWNLHSRSSGQGNRI